MMSKIAICALVAIAGLMSVEAAGRELLQDRVRASRLPEVPRAPRDSRLPEVPRAPRASRFPEEPREARRERGTQAPALPCDGDMCEPTWSKCAGSAFDKVSPCCGGDVCVMKSIYYSQCRPAGMDVPAGWVGNTMECGAASYGGETGAGSYGN